MVNTMSNIPSLRPRTPQKGVTTHSSMMGQGSACQEALYPRLSVADRRTV
jgi:hypothetical protein